MPPALRHFPVTPLLLAAFACAAPAAQAKAHADGPAPKAAPGARPERHAPGPGIRAPATGTPASGLSLLAPERDSATGVPVARLWPQGAPGALGRRASDQPSLLCFPAPSHPPGGPGPRAAPPGPGDSAAPAVIVCPGGAYGILALEKEGVQPARWLNSLGVSAFVLRYRLGPAYRHPVELGDARRAVRWVRAHARELGIDPKRVGMLGFSAGGHLTALAACLPEGPRNAGDTVDAVSCVPDLQMLIYPVISMAEPWTHRASRANLLGRAPAPAVLDSLSAERHVPAGAPPAFVVHAEADPIVDFTNSRAYVEALRKAGVPVEFIAFNAGGHAFGLAQEVDGSPGQAQLATWPGLCAKWMAARGFLR